MRRKIRKHKKSKENIGTAGAYPETGGGQFEKEAGTENIEVAAFF